MPVYMIYQICLTEDQLSRMRTDKTLSDAYLQGRFGQVHDAIEAGLHRYVATVDARDLEDLFYKTNSIEEAWVKGRKVLHIDDEFVRGAQSTSVGDVAIDFESKEAWLCATFGWEVMSWDRAERLFNDAVDRQPAILAKMNESEFEGFQR